MRGEVALTINSNDHSSAKRRDALRASGADSGNNFSSLLSGFGDQRCSVSDCHIHMYFEPSEEHHTGVCRSH